MSNFQLNIPISKVDEEQRIVYGYATVEELDRQGDIVDYEASKKAFSKWAGNIREQHDAKRAVGKNVHMEFDDTDRRVLIGAKISRSADGQNAWTKVQEGILTGFSIGGKVYKTIRETFKQDDEEITANRITDYDLAEVSLVDVPACPSAQFVMVKSADGKVEEVEEYHSVDTTPWFFKHYAIAPDQVNRKTDIPDNESMEKKDYSDKEREAMAQSGEALPDGSFPIKTVQDLKNAIKAYGRASNKAKAKNHIIKRAKALGKTSLLPESWNVKGDEPEMTKDTKKAVYAEDTRDSEAKPVENPVGDGPAEAEVKEEVVEESQEEVKEKAVFGEETRDAEGKPVPNPLEESKEEVKEEEVEESPESEVEPEADTESEDEVKEEAKPKAEKKTVEPETKKGLYAVAQLAECVENLTWIVADAEFEAQYENDGSDVPAKLKAAVAQVGAVLAEMASEEVSEATGGDDVEVLSLSDQPQDSEKMVSSKFEAMSDSLVKSLTDAVLGKVAEQLKPLEDRVNQLAKQPVGEGPKKTYTVVDKVADSPAQDDLEKKAADMEANPSKYTALERAELASELFKRSSRSRPILTN